MQKLLTNIAAANYVADDKQVEQLAADVALGNTAGATFLRVVLAACMAKLGGPRRGRRPKDMAGVLAAQDKALTDVHERFYPRVLAGVGGEGVDKIEQHRRANFARSAVATIRAVIRGGVDLRTVEIATATKTSLRKLVAPPEPTNRVERSMQRAEASILRALARLKRQDPHEAENVMERVQQAMQEVLDAKEERKGKTQARRTRATPPPAHVVSHQLRRSTDPAPSAPAPH